jgi:hypothetical protein
MLVAYTNSKLLSNTDTLTSWLEGPTGGVGGIQDWNNLKGERSLSSQDVPQRLVVSYVLDLPIGKGKKYLSGVSGIGDKIVSGWGIDGVTTFQRGFPVKFSYGGSKSQLKNFGFGIGGMRPDFVAGCNAATPAGVSKLNQWFNTACFTDPAPWAFGNEPRVDPRIRMDGSKLFDFAVFKRTKFGPDDRIGFEFRTEFFNLFNHPQFGPPGGTFGANNFGQVTSQVNNPRLIQFGGKLLF